MDPRLQELEIKAGVTLFDYQQQFLEEALQMSSPQRACLYYKTGAGKSLTALAAISLWGHDRCVVVTPPSTHQQWMDLGDRLGVWVIPMSHAKFRMPDTKLSRIVPVIADEMHLFGGQKGKGWRKLDKLAQHLQAPLILASATPNYNDAERVYCIQHVLDPDSCRGGYLQFIYQNCNTEQNPFGMEPIVTGFKAHNSAAEFLAAMNQVYYLPDDLVVDIVDVDYEVCVPDELIMFGYDRRSHRMMASLMEQRHIIRYQGLVNDDGYLHPDVLTEVLRICRDTEGKVLIYANHATIAESVFSSLQRSHVGCILVTGKTPKTQKLELIDRFKFNQCKIMIGTATLATGTDGLDRVCNTLLILDDTDDDALRRQLIGRIMPRGDFVSVADKQVFRMVPVPT